MATMVIVKRSLSLIVFLSLVSCGTLSAPPIAKPAPVRPALSVYEHFRIGALNFGDAREYGMRTNEQSTPVDNMGRMLPAMLLSELETTGRFAVYEAGAIRAGSGFKPVLSEATATGMVDGYLSGTITGWDTTLGQVCADVRLSNAYNHEIMHTSHLCMTASISPDKMGIDRASLKKLAQEIARAVKRIGYARVIGAEGRRVLVDKGTRNGIKRGMVAYLRDTGSAEQDTIVHAFVSEFTGVANPAEPVADMGSTPATSDTAAGGVANGVTGGVANPVELSQPALNSTAQRQLPQVIGELIIIHADEYSSLAELVRGGYALPNDTVFFK